MRTYPQYVNERMEFDIGYFSHRKVLEYNKLLLPKTNTLSCPN